MEFLLFIVDDPAGDPYDPALDDIADWVSRHDASGARVRGDRLQPASAAKTVRVRGDERIVTGGPFAETKEWIAGFDILECADLDEAIAIAAQHPMARFGRVEVRAFWPFEPEGPASG